MGVRYKVFWIPSEKIVTNHAFYVCVRVRVWKFYFLHVLPMVLFLTGADEQDVTAGHGFAVIASFEGTFLCASICLWMYLSRCLMITTATPHWMMQCGVALPSWFVRLPLTIIMSVTSDLLALLNTVNTLPFLCTSSPFPANICFSFKFVHFLRNMWFLQTVPSTVDSTQIAETWISRGRHGSLFGL